MVEVRNRVCYVSLNGCDTKGDGSSSNPFASIKKALGEINSLGSNCEIHWDQKGDRTYAPLTSCELEKAIKALNINSNHSENNSVSHCLSKKPRISDLLSFKDLRVAVKGWVSHIRRQSKKLIFLVLRDGSGDLQCVLTGDICNVEFLQTLSPESTVTVFGTVRAVPAGKIAPGGIELHCDNCELISNAPAGGLDSVLNEESSPDTLLNHRHLQLRTPEMISLMKVRSRALQAFRDHYFDRGYYEVTPPTLVQTQCEGGATLFKFDYFDQQAYLTQSSQMYLETVIPTLGNVFCIAQSYRAEQSRTRRHLADEMAFINFNDLIEALEDLVCDVLERIMLSDVAPIVRKFNPTLQSFKRPFRRMLYTDALVYLKEKGITKDDGSFYVFGDDIPEGPERKMTDQINEPIFLIKFPAELKSFYMSKDPADRTLTESVDLLLPGVGEVIGGSMRIWDEKELLDAYKHVEIDPKPYYWYTDQRKYGSCEHGGYGLGFERYLTWLLNRDHIRDVCLYPRFVGRCTP